MLKPKKLQYHTNEGKGKEKEKERGEGKEEKEKKAIVTLLVFIMATLDIVFGRKNCWTQKVSFGGNDFLNIYKIYIAPTVT